jgi:CSLREA domain-containing protein
MVIRRLVTALVIIVPLAVLEPTPAQAVNPTLFLVDSLADTIGNDGQCTLREAVTRANFGASDCAGTPTGDDVIDFAVGGTISLTLGTLPAINTNLTILGSGAVTITSGNFTPLLAVKATRSLSLDHLTLAHGGAFASLIGGGAISNTGTLILTNGTRLVDNAANGFGGAIYNTGQLIVHNGQFLRNQSGIAGGAIYSTGPVTVTQSEFADNISVAGGAMVVRDDFVIITGTAFHDNGTADIIDHQDMGGALLLTFFANGIVESSTFTANHATQNGAIRVEGGSQLAMTNSTVSGNTLVNNITHNNDGGLGNYGSVVSIDRVTFSGNAAGHFGGGLYNAGTATLINVTLSGNSAGVGGGLYNNITATTHLTNVTFSGNSASSGQGLSTGSGVVTLKNTVLADAVPGFDCEG